MKAFVLGGNGFIGSHLVERLCSAGHQVRVFDRSGDFIQQHNSDVEYVCGEFADIDLHRSSFDHVDIVYHLISTTVPSTSNEDPAADVVGNVVPTIKLLDLLVESKVRKIVFLSSGGTVYGRPARNPVPETAPTRPICSHGVTKLAIENYLHMYRELYGLRYAILRVSNPYGERQGHFGVQGVIGTFIETIIRNEVIEVWGDGSVQRDYIYVRDVAEACERAASTDVDGVFNIGSGHGYSITGVISRLATITQRQLEPVYLPARAYDVPRIVLDCKKARETLSWSASTGFSQGIERTWQWAQSQHR